MFSLLPLRANLEVCIPQYENQLIHFAGSYKNMYLVEADWLTKFESILSQLCFFSAKVINDFSGLEYEWDVNISGVTDEFKSDPPRPSPNWTFSVHKIERQPIEFRHAIDGSFSSSRHVPKRSGT